ncbi:MAG: DNA/RNA nuclease SfsA [Bacillota bacterium]
MLNYPFAFIKIRAHLVRRVNRFVVEAEIEGRRVEAYLANPGRLWELFLPGTELLLSPATSTNKLPYTVLACRKENHYILLHTHLANKLVRHLIETSRLEAFKNYRVIKEEPASGRHRFDLLLQHINTGVNFYLEIKSCTLFSGRVAMFPDAVTTRGTNHLYKLMELSTMGAKTGCLFVVMNPKVKYFLPSYHIDYNFSDAFLKVKDSVLLEAVAVGFDHSFTEVNSINPVKIPFDFLNIELQDRGAYLLLIKIETNKMLTIGSLGSMQFEQGYYVYVGSAMGTLSKRVARHTRKRKQKRWHIDYLVAAADAVTPVPIISSDSLECELADQLREISGQPVKSFGSSDCSCKSHLFYFTDNPLHNPHFIDFIQYYRIRRLDKKFDSL